MNKQKLTTDAVLDTATTLIKNNGTTTTLDVKRELRNAGTYEAFQGEVSRMMNELYGEGKLGSTDDATRPYQIYSLPQDGAAQTPSTKATVIQDLLTTSQNPAVMEILTTLTTKPSITRSEIVEAVDGGSNNATVLKSIGARVDTALQSLMKKGLIVRISKGTYQATVGTTAHTLIHASVAPSALSVEDVLKLELELVKRKNAKLELFVQKADEAAGLIRAALDELKN